MASKRIKGITIEINGDVTGLNKALEGVDKNLKSTEDALKDVNKLLKLDPTNTELLSQKHELLQKAVKNTETRLDALKKAQKESRDEFGNPISTEQYDAIQREIVETEEKLKSLKAETGSASDKLAAASAITGKVSEVTGKIGDVFMPVTMGLVGVGTAAVKTVSDLESSMDEVQALIYKTAESPEALAEEMEKLEKKAREMGATTTFSANDAAQAFKYMGMAGWDTEQMVAGVDGIMYLAESQMMDLAEASDIVTDAITAFGDKAGDAGRYADVMAAASSSANTNVSMMGESFKYVAPVAGQMGYSIEDTALAIALMANAGVKGSNSGTALRSMLTNLAYPTDKVKNAMEELGISLVDDQGNMKSLEQVIKELRESFGQLKIPAEEFDQEMGKLTASLEAGEITEEEFNEETAKLMERAYGAEGAMKAQYAATIAGKTGMAGFLALLAPTNEEFDELSGTIKNSAGTAEEMAAIMRDNLNGQIKILMSGLSELAISLGKILLPYVIKFVKWLQKVVDWFNGLDESQKKMIVTIAAIVAAIGPVFKIISKVSGVISVVTGLLSKVGALSGIVSGGITAISGAFAALASPIGIAIAAVVAIGAALVFAYKHCEAFRNAVNKAVQGVKDTLAKLPEYFQEFIEGLGVAFDNAVECFKSIPGKAADAVEKIGDVVGGAIVSVQEWLANGFISIVDGTIKSFKEMRDGAVSKMTDLKNKAVNFAEILKTSVTQKFEDLKTKSIEKTKAMKEKVVGFFTGLGQDVKTGVENMKKSVVEKYNAIKDEATTKIKNLRENVVEVFASLPGRLSGSVSSVASTIIGGFSRAANYVRDLVGKASGWASDFVNGFSSGITSRLGKLSQSVSTMANRVRSFLHFSRPDVGPLRDYEKWPKDFMKGYAEGLRKNSRYITNVMEGITGKMEAVKPAFSAMYEATGPAMNFVANTEVTIGGKKFDAYVTKTSMKGTSQKQAGERMAKGYV